MEKYHAYEKGSGNYICTLYTYTDVLNLQIFAQEKGTEIEIHPLTLSKSEIKSVFGNPDLKRPKLRK